MTAEYELWLDESGDFTREVSKQQQRLKGSLVGGILMDKPNAERIARSSLVDPGRNHAMKMDPADKAPYVLSTLEKIRDEYGAREVFFENAEYIDMKNSRSLYLQIVAEGILRLLQYLNAGVESVSLNVLIAHRMDRGVSSIEPEEYIQRLMWLIGQKRRQNRILLDSNSRLSIEFEKAHRSQKLQLADFACNTRLTRDSQAFSGPDVRNRVFRLHEQALIFTMVEQTAFNRIQQQLAQGYIADSIMEYFNIAEMLDVTDRKKITAIICERLGHTNYRLLKSQMKDLSSQLTAKVAVEDDYEITERLLKRIEEEFLPVLEKSGAPYLQLEFNLYLQLADVFLREGDTSNAAEMLKKCEERQRDAGNHIEDLFTWYQLLEKQGLLLIDTFEYKKAVKVMESASAIFTTLMTAVVAQPEMKTRFPDICSEYYGDALCMQIYAMMFLQREQPELYDELVRLSDIALTQYPAVEGELERHRQYRSHIEMEAGKYEEALRWLILAKEIQTGSLGEDDLISFLDTVTDTEPTISCWYYLMYYTLIMAEAKRSECPLADIMFGALQKSQKLLRAYNVGATKMSGGMIEVNIVPAQMPLSGEAYHPVEVVYWKLADYLLHAGQGVLALPYYQKALVTCLKRHDKANQYLTMRVTGTAIWADYIACLLKQKNRNNSAIRYQYGAMTDYLDSFPAEKLSDAEKELLDRMKVILDKAKGADNKIDPEMMLRIGRLITY